MSAGYIPFHPNPSKPKYKPPAGAVDTHCHVFGPEAVFPFAPKRKYTPCDPPKEKLFALRDFLGFDKNVMVQASATARTTARWWTRLLFERQGQGHRLCGRGDHRHELPWMDHAGVKGVRFNFIKRLVDSTPRRDAASPAHRPLGWRIVIYFEHAELERWRFFPSLPTTLVFDHMGWPNVKEGVDGKHFQNRLKALDANKNWITKVTCPERFTVAGPPYDDVVPFARDRRAVPRPRDLGHRLAASQYAEGGARRRRPGRHDPEDRADGGAATKAAGRQSDAALLALRG